MKKFILKLLLLLLIGFVIYFGYKEYFGNDNYKNRISLKEIGYDKDDIKYLFDNLSSDDIKLIINNGFDDAINLTEDNEFNSEFLEKYLIYINKNSNINLSEVIIIVNNGFNNIDYNPIYIKLIEEKYYKKEYVSRYINYFNIHKTYSSTEIIRDVNANIDYKFYENNIDTDITRKELSIANKFYTLKSNFEGFDIITMDKKYSYYDKYYKLNKDAYEAFEKMWEEANKEGLIFKVYSAYRSFDAQNNIYNNYVSRDGITKADTYSARPGHSEHQLGLAVDLKSGTMDTSYFQNTNEYIWLKNNAYKYGFILRYPKGKEFLTGYQFEPWHWRYCGIECATYIHENNITFDEYYEYFIKKD